MNDVNANVMRPDRVDMVCSGDAKVDSNPHASSGDNGRSVRNEVGIRGLMTMIELHFRGNCYNNERV